LHWCEALFVALLATTGKNGEKATDSQQCGTN